MSGQLADAALVSGEQMAACGANSVRGYLSAEATGDYGVSGTVEWRTPQLTYFSRLENWRLFAFADGARLRLRDPLPEQKDLFGLTSVGVGSSFQFLRCLNGRIDFAYPLRDGLRTHKHVRRINFNLSASVQQPVGAAKDVTVFGTLGLIPLEYSSDNAPSRSQAKMSSENKWLLGAQVGASWKINSDHQLRGALAYYNFRNISGEYSQPCALYAGADGCSTDWSRPSSMQKGNSLMLLRNIALNPLDPANTPQPQFVGLASKFRLANLNARWDGRVAGGTDLRIEGDYVRNMAYDKNAMWARAEGGIMNNFGGTGGVSQADFKSGGNAYMLQATLGKASPRRRAATGTCCSATSASNRMPCLMPTTIPLSTWAARMRAATTWVARMRSTRIPGSMAAGRGAAKCSVRHCRSTPCKSN